MLDEPGRETTRSADHPYLAAIACRDCNLPRDLHPAGAKAKARYDGHGRRVIVDAYDTIIMREVAPDRWAVTVEGDWTLMLDVARAIIAATPVEDDR